MTLIIDCHGHYTTAPAAHNKWRETQMAAHENGDTASIQALGAMIKIYGEDLGLANLRKRLEKTKNGESYALG